MSSIADLQEAVGLPKVAKALGVGRFSAGSFSESVRVKLDGAQHPVRRIEVQVTPHARRFRSGSKEIDLIALHTNLDPAAGCQNLAAQLVAAIYLQRYTVDLFFRCFKQMLGMRHRLSQREEGIDIQIYCTVISCLLIQIISGKKPNKAMRNIIAGTCWASLTRRM